MPDTWTLTLDNPDRYGREQVRTVNLTIDIRDFKDKAGFAWLVLAANPHLSVRDIQEVLAGVGEQHERPVGWISRRRWMFHGTGKPGSQVDPQKAALARTIMEDNPTASNRQLAGMFRAAGLSFSRDYARRHRVGGV